MPWLSVTVMHIIFGSRDVNAMVWRCQQTNVIKAIYRGPITPLKITGFPKAHPDCMFIFELKMSLGKVDLLEQVVQSNLCNEWKVLLSPIGSMYGIFTYIWLIFMVNVGKYTIHGCNGSCQIGSSNLQGFGGRALLFSADFQVNQLLNCRGCRDCRVLKGGVTGEPQGLLKQIGVREDWGNHKPPLRI